MIKEILLDLVIAGKNPFALDIVAVSAVGIAPDTVPTIKRAQERGLVHALNQVQVVGDEKISFPVIPFTVPQISQFARFPIPNSINRFLERYLNPRPVFAEEICVKCEVCIRSCPPKALVMQKHKPEVDLANCIRCYCCQELCPKNAVTIKRPWLTRKLLGRGE